MVSTKEARSCFSMKRPLASFISKINVPNCTSNLSSKFWFVFKKKFELSSSAGCKTSQPYHSFGCFVMPPESRVHRGQRYIYASVEGYLCTSLKKEENPRKDVRYSDISVRFSCAKLPVLAYPGRWRITCTMGQIYLPAARKVLFMQIKAIFSNASNEFYAELIHLTNILVQGRSVRTDQHPFDIRNTEK